MATTDFAPRRAAFRKLHESGCFVIPNPWDIGTALYLRHLGFQALATTSAGFACSIGMPDADWAVPCDLMLKHIAELVSATELPVNADFESGYSHEPQGVAANVRLCVETGVAGLSIEDATGDREKPLYDLPLAVERIQAARSAIGEALLVGRAECFLVGHSDPLRESIRRLQAYAQAGADVLYAPGVRERADIKAIVAAVHPKPVNVLAPAGLKVSDLAELGVRRVSVGSSLSRAAWTGFIRASKLIAEEGSFAGLEGVVPYSDLNEFFRDVAK
jgi:2-methylisocitrate lyase-like PEP mutase family enzyme